MRGILAYPGNMAHAQNIALALYDAGYLDFFITNFFWNPSGRAQRLLDGLPGPLSNYISPQLMRRSIRAVPPDYIRSIPGLELLRTFCQRLIGNEVLVDFVWDQFARNFDATVARRYVPHAKAISAFEYTALASFERAKELGIARILHLPALDSREFEEVRRRELREWPELEGKYDAYFNAMFERRYARRRAEVELADLIFTNSARTARSHIRAGADPSKVFSVPLAAPPAVSQSDLRLRPMDAPLRVIWAGHFSIGKGAHYMLSAWRKLAVGDAAHLDVYGQIMLPQRLNALQEQNVAFYGTVPQIDLFAKFLEADLLVFPTLSDGFGMVVAEAFAHGVPVITTEEAGAAELVHSGNGFVVPAANPDALANAIRWCLDNRQKLQEMRFNALETARNRQWSAFRSEFIAALNTGLTRMGYV